MIDFPASPTIGQTFTAAGVTWTWDGAKWTLGPSAPNLITVSDTPPPNPTQGALWWESVNGQMYVFYNDGSSSQWAPTTNQMGGGYMPLQGVADGSSAAPGMVGEVITAKSAGVSLTTSVLAAAATLNLSPGDWDVRGAVGFSATASASNTQSMGISLSSTAFANNPPFNGASATVGGPTNIGSETLGVPPVQFSFATATNVYLLAIAVFTSGTVTANVNSWIQARRVR